MNSFTYEAGTGNVRVRLEIHTPEGGAEAVTFSIRSGEGPALKLCGTDEAKAAIAAFQVAVDRAEDYRRIVTGNSKTEAPRYPGRP